MGVLGQSRDTGAGAVTAPMTGPVDKASFWRRYNSNEPVLRAGFRQQIAGFHATKVGQAIYETRYYDQIVNALNAEGEQGVDYVPSLVKRDSPSYHHVEGERVNENGVVFIPVKRPFRNPYSGGKDIGGAISGYFLGGDAAEKHAVWAAVDQVRRRGKSNFLNGFADESAVIAHADAQRQRDYAAASAVTERATGVSGTVAGFAGNMAGSLLTDIENVVGGGFGTAAGKTIARQIIRRGAEGIVANTGASLLAAPGQVVDAREHLGLELTRADIAHQGKVAAVLGAAFGVTHVIVPKVAAKGAEIVGKVADKVTAIPPVRDALMAASIRAGTIQDHTLINDWAATHDPNGPNDISTPDERAAAHVIVRDAATRETSPLHPEASAANAHRLDAMAASLGVNLHPDLPSPAPIQHATVRDRAEGGRKPATYDQGLHAAEGTTHNPDSSADGHFQFTEGTWLEYAPRVADTKGMSRAQVLALRHDLPTATRAEALFRGDNARYLRSRGLEDSPGNLSLAHFLGRGDAAKVLEAAPGTPIERVVDHNSYAANAAVFGKHRTAGDVINWAHKRIGAAVNGPVARSDAVPDADGLAGADYADTPYGRGIFRPDQIETDAALMQYKSDGDENGVTGKLRDVTQWDPIMSSEILAWEGNDGRRVVVDGHQRVGLAKRLAAEGQDISIPALILREDDGITAAQARVIGALRNINLGTGSLLDNARVLRDAPQAAEKLKGAENRREIEGLAKLNYEAFGAAINDVIDPRVAAEIGKYAGDRPETHMPLIALLTKERVASPGEAGVIVRQALADGFGSHDANQLGMFDEHAVSSLYVPIARILKASASRLRDEKRTFKTLADKAGKIEAAGNVLDQAANEGRVIGSDEALAILNATAHSGGPVRDALIAAARAELSGVRRSHAVNQFLDALAGIDLLAAARGTSEGGFTGESLGETGSRDAAAEADRVLSASDGPGLYDHAVATRDAAEPFSDPVGEAAKEQTAVLHHDLLMDAAAEIDPAIAERQHQEAMLGAASPLQSIAEQQGTMGLGLFDVADQPTFRLSDEGNARPLADIMGEAENDEAAAKALRDCL